MRATPLLILCLALPAEPAAEEVFSLSRQYSETGAPAAREALARYVAGQPPPADAHLAYLALGIGDYNEKRFAAAAGHLGPASRGELADYAVYYHALALVAAADHAGAAPLTAGFAERFPDSALAPAATRQRIDSLSQAGQARQALGLTPEKPRAASDWVLVAKVAERAGEPRRAAEAWQQVYFGFPNGTEQTHAQAALAALRTKLAARYPAPSTALRLGRSDALFAAQKYSAARLEYRSLAAILKGLAREQAAVRVGACDQRLRYDARGFQYLKRLSLTQPEAAAERLYYLLACSRRLKRESEITGAVEQLGRQHRGSRWLEEALLAAANYFLIENNPTLSAGFHQALVEQFPQGRYAETAHWKLAWRAYQTEPPAEARRRLERHLQQFPSSPNRTAALYWLARLAEASDRAAARALYQYLITAYPLYYHSILAQDHWKKLAAAEGPAPAWVSKLVAGAAAPPGPPAAQPSPGAASQLTRAHLLARLGLVDLAERELRFRAEAPELAYYAGLELAQLAAEHDQHHRAIRLLKRYTPGYLAYPIASMPRQYWELLFPWPWRREIQGYSQAHNLDPYVVAALIRQESEFNPGAVSPARARGLMQIVLPTGRRLGRNLGMGALTVSHLHVPDTSLRLGTLHLRHVLDMYDGRLELALAGYNAGEQRVERWLQRRPADDLAAFVESIPFTETRTYVQAVLRNAYIYRKLYGG